MKVTFHLSIKKSSSWKLDYREREFEKDLIYSIGGRIFILSILYTVVQNSKSEPNCSKDAWIFYHMWTNRHVFNWFLSFIQNITDKTFGSWTPFSFCLATLCCACCKYVKKIQYSSMTCVSYSVVILSACMDGWICSLSNLFMLLNWQCWTNPFFHLF